MMQTSIAIILAAMVAHQVKASPGCIPPLANPPQPVANGLGYHPTTTVGSSAYVNGFFTGCNYFGAPTVTATNLVLVEQNGFFGTQPTAAPINNHSAFENGYFGPSATEAAVLANGLFETYDPVIATVNPTMAAPNGYDFFLRSRNAAAANGEQCRNVCEYVPPCEESSSDCHVPAAPCRRPPRALRIESTSYECLSSYSSSDSECVPVPQCPPSDSTEPCNYWTSSESDSEYSSCVSESSSTHRFRRPGCHAKKPLAAKQRRGAFFRGGARKDMSSETSESINWPVVGRKFLKAAVSESESEDDAPFYGRLFLQVDEADLIDIKEAATLMEKYNNNGRRNGCGCRRPRKRSCSSSSSSSCSSTSWEFVKPPKPLKPLRSDSHCHRKPKPCRWNRRCVRTVTPPTPVLRPLFPQPCSKPKPCHKPCRKPCRKQPSSTSSSTWTSSSSAYCHPPKPHYKPCVSSSSTSSSSCWSSSSSSDECSSSSSSSSDSCWSSSSSSSSCWSSSDSDSCSSSSSDSCSSSSWSDSCSSSSWSDSCSSWSSSSSDSCPSSSWSSSSDCSSEQPHCGCNEHLVHTTINCHPTAICVPNCHDHHVEEVVVVEGGCGCPEPAAEVVVVNAGGCPAPHNNCAVVTTVYGGGCGCGGGAHAGAGGSTVIVAGSTTALSTATDSVTVGISESGDESGASNQTSASVHLVWTALLGAAMLLAF